jgi:hypothetical protein
MCKNSLRLRPFSLTPLVAKRLPDRFATLRLARLVLMPILSRICQVAKPDFKTASFTLLARPIFVEKISSEKLRSEKISK